MKARRSKGLRVRGMRWRVKVVSPKSKSLRLNQEFVWGMCHLLKNEISLSSERPTDGRMETLFHEIIHSSRPQLGERAVGGVTESLFPVLVDNGLLNMRRWRELVKDE